MLLPGGHIAVDGRVRGDGEATIEDLAVGEHVIHVELDGYVPVDETVHIDAGKVVRFKRTLDPVPVAVIVPAPVEKPVERPVERPVVAPPIAPEVVPRPVTVVSVAPATAEPGKIVVTVQGGGWADVWIDGQKQSKTAPLTVSLPPGAHTVRLENGSLGIDQTETIDVASGGSARVVGKPK